MVDMRNRVRRLVEEYEEKRAADKAECGADGVEGARPEAACNDDNDTRVETACTTDHSEATRAETPRSSEGA